MMTEAVAKLAGVARWAVSIVYGTGGIFSTLQNEHAELTTLMEEIEAAGPERRRELFGRLRVELLAHASAEKSTLYSYLAGDPDMEDKVADGVAAHQQIQDVLQELGSTRPESHRWMIRFKLLRALIEDHVDDEETEVFPEAEKAITGAQSATLDRAFRDEKSAQVRMLDTELTKPIDTRG